MSLLPDWLTGYDSENADRAAAADAQLRAINQARIDEGFFTPVQAARIQSDYDSQFDFGVDAQRADIDKTFTDSVKENTSAFNKGVWGLVKTILSAVPLSVWIIAGLVVFFMFGGPALVKSLFRRVKA